MFPLGEDVSACGENSHCSTLALSFFSFKSSLFTRYFRPDIADSQVAMERICCYFWGLPASVHHGEIDN